MMVVFTDLIFPITTTCCLLEDFWLHYFGYENLRASATTVTILLDKLVISNLAFWLTTTWKALDEGYQIRVCVCVCVCVSLSPQTIHLAFWPWFKKDKAEERDYSTA